MSSVRTQIYMTPEQRKRLDALSHRDGRSLAAHVREAIDAYLRNERPDRAVVLEATFAAMPDLEVPPRGEWDRGY